MTVTAATVDILLMGKLGKGPAGWTTLLGVLVDAGVPLGAAELVLRNWIRDGVLRRQIEPCPFATDCYRLHTKVNVARRPTQADPGVKDVDDPEPLGALNLYVFGEDGKAVPVTALEVANGCGDESQPPKTAAEWRARALNKQRIRP